MYEVVKKGIRVIKPISYTNEPPDGHLRTSPFLATRMLAWDVYETSRSIIIYQKVYANRSRKIYELIIQIKYMKFYHFIYYVRFIIFFSLYLNQSRYCFIF